MGETKGKAIEKEKKPVLTEKKKEEGPPKVVLKIDIHCDGCASKIKRCIKGFEGVEAVIMDMADNKVTVIGTVDHWKLRDHVEAKTRKTVEIVSPANPPKKDDDGGKKPAATEGKKAANGDKKAADGDKKSAADGDKKSAAGDSKDKKKPDDRKSKEPATSTVVLKVRLHCDGCIQRIKKTILKIKGVQDVSVDAQKDLVTVKGTMDVNTLPTHLKEKVNRGVEIVAVTTGGGGGGGNEKKDKPAATASVGGGAAAEKKEKGESGGGADKKGNGAGGGGEKKGIGGGGGVEKKNKDGGGGGGKKEEKPEATVSVSAMAAPFMEGNKIEYYGGAYGYRPEMVHAPQLFSDENPNACFVM